MKIKTLIKLFTFFSFSFFVFGCTWIDTNTKIVKDANEKVVESEYTRSIKGFTPFGDKESANSWAQADQTVRNHPNRNNTFPRSSYMTGNKTTTDGKKYIVVKNELEFPIQIDSPKINTPYLDPGQSTEEFPVSLGKNVINFTYGGQEGEKHSSVTMIITPTTDVILVTNQHRFRW